MSFRFIIYLIILGIPLILFGLLMSMSLLPCLLFFIPVFITAFSYVKIQRQRMVLVLIQNALETETPIHEVLHAYAACCWGPWYRAKVIRFADNIQEGHSIVTAASASKNVLRYEAVGFMKLGGSSKQLGKLLAQTTSEFRRNGQIQLQSMFRFSWYCNYLPFLVLPALFYMVAIMPKMEMIFKDFSIQLPSVTLFTIYLSQMLLDYFYLFSIPIFVLVFAPFFYFNLRSGIYSFRPPGIRRLLRQRDSARFLRLFAAGLELKKPIEEIVEVYTQVVPSRYLRHLSRRFEKQTAQGMDWIESLRKIHWLSSGESALLDSAVRTDHVETMLSEVANSKEQRQLVLDNTAGQTFFILCVLGFGAFAALQAIAFFMPLVQLINALVN
ncbi:MAG: hypothetical protein LBQ50_11880 [Planctomycetaceae bacterium]|jgi:type II secretory pathway component PulF|nr:hypothetical protein [Planctomycetaceae bacterium]